MLANRYRSLLKSFPSGDDLCALIENHLQSVQAMLADCAKKAFGRLAETVAHTLGAGGKMIRPTLTLLSAWAVGEVNERTIAYATAIELIHTASLLHDDVIDDASVRRCKPTVNYVWGDKAAITTGDFMLACAFELLAKHNDERVLRDIAETAQQMCCGQMLESTHSFNLGMSYEEYLEIIKLKTGKLFASACFAGGISAGASPEEARCLKEFGLLVGIAFQMIDDLLDFIGTENELGKPVGQDMRHGKITLPLIELIRVFKADEESNLAGWLLKKLKEREVDDELIAFLRQAIVQRRIDERVKSVAKSFIDDAVNALRNLRGKRWEVLSLVASLIHEW